jgi:DNA ligase 1
MIIIRITIWPVSGTDNSRIVALPKIMDDGRSVTRHWHDGEVRFADVAVTSAAVAATSKRLTKLGLLADALRQLRETDAEIAAGAAFLAGELRQRQIGVGWAALRDLPEPATEASLTVGQVDAAFAEIGAQSGAGSQGRRRELLISLFGAATEPEQALLRGLISGELRQGAQAGLLADAIARAADVDLVTVRRALLFSGDLKAVAVAALQGGVDALATIGLEVGRPLTPMLAQAAQTIAEALDATGMPAVVDAKLDGIRIQVHRRGDEVAVFTRSLDDITSRLPEVVRAVRTLPVDAIVLDGEAIALGSSGLPLPFQETSARAATREATPTHRDADGTSAATRIAMARPTTDVAIVLETPAADEVVATTIAPAASAAAGAAADDKAGILRPYFFDLLHLDGRDLVDEPGHRRWQVLADIVPADLLVTRTMVDDVAAAQAAGEAALAAGHEGVVVKAANAPYDVGRRGNAWVKVKPRHTLDLVVLAVEWGHGRREGKLSNLHLGARDPETGGFVMLGKTFKGMTDEILRWQTERFTELAVDGRVDDWVVTVRPEQVVEIAFDGVQTSTRYPGGVALRFARVVRYREDKRAEDADTIDAVRALKVPAPAPGRS